MRTSRVTTKQCVEAIHNSGGFITPAAKQLNISQAALSKRIKKSKALQQALAETKEQYLDLAETQLIKAVRDREAWAICFYLKCKGKDRGYVEKRQISVDDSKPITFKYNLVLPENTKLVTSEGVTIHEKKGDSSAS